MMKPPPQVEVPNLDAADYDELWSFWSRHSGGRLSRALFPQGGAGTVMATGDLANYACNLAVARRQREQGNVSAAEIYELICDRIYDGLPSWAKW
jgi:hypothetical protein